MSTATNTETALSDCKVADINLADWGRKEIQIAETTGELPRRRVRRELVPLSSQPLGQLVRQRICCGLAGRPFIKRHQLIA